MICVASFMSSASLTTNNPYLNSNVMFDKKVNSYLNNKTVSSKVDSNSELSDNTKLNFNFSDENIINEENNIDY